MQEGVRQISEQSFFDRSQEPDGGGKLKNRAADETDRNGTYLFTQKIL